MSDTFEAQESQRGSYSDSYHSDSEQSDQSANKSASRSKSGFGKALHDDEADYAANPELYGLRRSGRSTPGYPHLPHNVLLPFTLGK